MKLDTARKPLTDGKSYLRDWIEATYPEHGLGHSGSHAHNDEGGQCLAVRLYSCCLSILQQRLQLSSSINPLSLQGKKLHEQAWLFREELGRLYLCGGIFEECGIEQALEHALDLRDTLVEILVRIGTILIRGESLYLRCHFKRRGSFRGLNIL